MSTQPDDEFISAVIAQDEKAFRKLVQLYHNNMVAIARGIVGEAFSEEVVQEAWIRIHKALPKFEKRSSLKTWIFRITSNQAINRYNKEARHKKDISIDADLESKFQDDGHWSKPPTPWHEDTPEALLLNKELKDCVSKNINNLSDMQQAAFVLRDMEGQSYDDICNILDLNMSNVRVLIHRARHKLFTVVEHFQETGEC